MIKKELLVDVSAGQTRLALIEDGQTAELYVEREGHAPLTGNLYVGRVMNLLSGMQAAFVEIGEAQNAFLSTDDVPLNRAEFDGDSAAALTGRSTLRPGQTLLVQVVKEPTGGKGARVTSHVTLPGRFTVLLPTIDYLGVSRRIESDEVRSRLRVLCRLLRPDGMGLIVRTAAEEADEAEIEAEVYALLRRWEYINIRAQHSTAPALIYRAEDILTRAVADLLEPGVERLTLNDKAAYERALSIADSFAPVLRERIVLDAGETPLFARYKVERDIDRALTRKVWLNSGGYVVFDYAEALTAIDVNTGKYTGKKSLSDTVFRINCEAALEIARQIRLRNLGGIIVIDFIDMDEESQRAELIGLFGEALRRDRVKTNLAGLTKLGLVEMTRKKSGPTLYAALGHASGEGQSNQEKRTK